MTDKLSDWVFSNEDYQAMSAKLKRMQEALQFYAHPENVLFMEEYGFLEYGEQTEAEQHTNKLGTRARKALEE